MANDNLGVPEAGQAVSATWLAKLYWMVRRNRVTVARDCGLTMVESPGGKVIGLAPQPTVFLGITTTTIQPRSNKTVYFGTVQPYVLSAVTYSGAQQSSGTMVAYGAPVRVFNWTGSTVSSGVWVKYIKINGQWAFNGNDCSGVAP